MPTYKAINKVVECMYRGARAKSVVIRQQQDFYNIHTHENQSLYTCRQLRQVLTDRCQVLE